MNVIGAMRKLALIMKSKDVQNAKEMVYYAVLDVMGMVFLINIGGKIGCQLQ
ncbi:hypothetical protein [Caldalkalibacillus mannanilyticus]|uniref:hypothetical protein n=1 Tax=Caldalkalibacillus mannanilyticus TaxID=1418 RepID=UPI00131ED68C|nr:hypothetical protein [Caldalkalibacillus mannanilyticus]